MSFTRRTPIIHEYPPNIDDIDEMFHARKHASVVFAYAPNIHVPNGKPLPEWIIAHEEKHIQQQGDRPDVWWERYMTDETFRFQQELAAHRAEYQAFRRIVKDREEQNRALMFISMKMIDPLYKYTSPLAPHQVRALIQS